MQDLKAQAATFSPREMLKQYVPTLHDDENDVIPISNDSPETEVPETTVLEQYLENVDGDLLKKQLDDMKSMMLELGIDEDDAFKQLEDEINSFSEDGEGSGSLAESLLDLLN